MKLTSEQITAIENSQWIVNDLLKGYGVSFDNDLRQSALLYMCECMLRYNPQRGKWETYAYSNVKHFVLRSLKHLTAEKARLCSYDENIASEYEYDEIDKAMAAKTRIMAIKSACSVRERRVMDLLTAGFSKVEVAKKIGRSPSTVSGIIKSIREKQGDYEMLSDDIAKGKSLNRAISKGYFDIAEEI